MTDKKNDVSIATDIHLRPEEGTGKWKEIDVIVKLTTDPEVVLILGIGIQKRSIRGTRMHNKRTALFVKKSAVSDIKMKESK